MNDTIDNELQDELQERMSLERMMDYFTDRIEIITTSMEKRLAELRWYISRKTNYNQVDYKEIYFGLLEEAGSTIPTIKQARLVIQEFNEKNYGSNNILQKSKYWTICENCQPKGIGGILIKTKKNPSGILTTCPKCCYPGNIPGTTPALVVPEGYSVNEDTGEVYIKKTIDDGEFKEKINDFIESLYSSNKL